jgi:hypothetical protein
MKRVRYGLIAATLVGLLLTGCSNFGLVVGLPTVSIASPDNLQATVTREEDSAGNITLIYTYEYDIVLNALPGSPAGRIFLRSGGLDVFGATIPSCPTTEKDFCPNRFPIKVTYRRRPSDPPPVATQITSYVAQSLNETTQKENPINYPVSVY